MYIKIDKPDMSIDNEKELALDLDSHPLIAKTSSAIYYCSASVVNLIGKDATDNLANISNRNLPRDQQFNIELAVAAGNIYRMLLDQPQPKFYSGFDQHGT